MKTYPAFTLIAATLILSSSANEKWTSLFNGESLDGWIQRGGKAKYTVEDGCIVGRTIPKTPNSFLCTEKQYGDFILEYEFKVDPRLNSGVQIKSQTKDAKKQDVLSFTAPAAAIKTISKCTYYMNAFLLVICCVRLT